MKISKTIIRNSIHNNSQSHDILIKSYDGRKVKFVYEAYNAVEKMNTYIFDGVQWQLFLIIYDLGVLPEKDYYIKSKEQREKRAEELFSKSETMLVKILEN